MPATPVPDIHAPEIKAGKLAANINHMEIKLRLKIINSTENVNKQQFPFSLTGTTQNKECLKQTIITFQIVIAEIYYLNETS
jgi:hypothetical protein